MHTAQREVRARKNPNYNSASFHAHQIAEIYLKAFMLKNKLSFGKTHNLEELLAKIRPSHPDFELIRDVLAILNQYSVATRYPGTSIAREEAKEAVKLGLAARQFIRSRMGLPLEK